MRLTFYDVIRPCPTVRSLAFSVLQTLISNAGCLEGSPQEAIVWLSVFQETFDKKEDLSDAVVNMLVESMTRTCTSCPKYLDIIACAEEGAVEMLNLVGTSESSTFDGAVLQELFDGIDPNFICFYVFFLDSLIFVHFTQLLLFLFFSLNSRGHRKS